jgi:hypothetical protein
MPKLICGWCRKTFEKELIKAKTGERVPLVCPNCARTLPGSKKEPTENLVGRKHIHRDWKEGDIVL